MLKKTVIAQAIMAASMGAFGHRETMFVESNNDDIDIKKEYELIKQKKSKLSARKRRWVVRQVEINN